MGVPRYFRDFRRFRAAYSGPIRFLPCLHDWDDEAGATRDEYFWQDLLVAQLIYAARPATHVDVGSRIDGFVAHVASFRDIEVFDIRPVTVTIPGVTFRRVDFTKMPVEMTGYCDSVSCLHALEHFGLGRYGDAVDADGYRKGLANVARLLRPSGVLYLSVPVGAERVEFNSHRVLDPRELVKLAEDGSLLLSGVTVLNRGGERAYFPGATVDLASLGAQDYSLGIFTFVKESRPDSLELVHRVASSLTAP